VATSHSTIPGKSELQQAGYSLASNGRTSLSRRTVERLAPTVRKLALAERGNASSRAETSRGTAVALSALESGVLAQVNAVRRSHGLRVLRISPALTAAAGYHSRQMVQHGFFEHESRGGGSFWKRVERFYRSGGFRSWEVGENLAYGSPDLSAAATVRMWMNSPGHRDNLLARRWREVGLGALHVEAAGGEFGGGPVTVVTADFGTRAR
jgi:uncharacterized protein YkwD